jgi:hypothetical protein
MRRLLLRLKVGRCSVETRVMDTPAILTRLRRETLVTRLAIAYAERDFRTMDREMREDVMLVLPGISPFAGEHHGHESVGRFLHSIRQFVLSAEPAFEFVHHANLMTATHEITVAGPNHVAEMTLRITFTFDREERISSMHVKPSDPELFTHVIAGAFSLAS